MLISTPNVNFHYLDTLLTVLQCDGENRERLKYLRNVYCVKTNQSADQDT